MDYRERESRAWSVYPTQDTSRIYRNSKGEARRRSGDKNNSKRVVRNLEERNVGTKRRSRKQNLTSAKDLTIKLTDGCDYPYHRLD